MVFWFATDHVSASPIRVSVVRWSFLGCCLTAWYRKTSARLGKGRQLARMGGSDGRPRRWCLRLCNYESERRKAIATTREKAMGSDLDWGEGRWMMDHGDGTVGRMKVAWADHGRLGKQMMVSYDWIATNHGGISSFLGQGGAAVDTRVGGWWREEGSRWWPVVMKLWPW